MEELIKEISSYIIERTMKQCKDADAFQSVFMYSEFQENFARKIDEVLNDSIINQIAENENVADVLLDTDGFDIVFFTNSIGHKEDEEE